MIVYSVEQSRQVKDLFKLRQYYVPVLYRIPFVCQNFWLQYKLLTEDLGLQAQP